MNNVVNKLKGMIVVSVQAMPSEPLYLEKCMVAMMKSVVTGGAGALRVAGVRDVKNAKRLFHIPVIGITKPNVIPKNWKEIVYITPTIKDVIDLIEAGADVIALDGTQRKRPNNEKLEDLIKYIHINKKVAMADISIKEINVVKAVFKKHLQEIYHARIAYPAKKQIAVDKVREAILND